MDDFVGMATAVKILKITRQRILKLISDGRIAARLVDGRYLMRRADLADFAKLDRPAGNPGLRKSK